MRVATLVAFARNNCRNVRDGVEKVVNYGLREFDLLREGLHLAGESHCTGGMAGGSLIRP